MIFERRHSYLAVIVITFVVTCCAFWFIAPLYYDGNTKGRFGDVRQAEFLSRDFHTANGHCAATLDELVKWGIKNEEIYAPSAHMLAERVVYLRLSQHSAEFISISNSSYPIVDILDYETKTLREIYYQPSRHVVNETRDASEYP